MPQGPLRFRMCAPLTRPAMTPGLPGTRSRSARTFTAGGDSGTARGPVLLSRNRISVASRSTSCHCRVRTSLHLQPVSIRSRIAAAAVYRDLALGHHLAQHPPQAPELPVSQEPLALARPVLDDLAAGIGPASGTMPHASAIVNIRASTSTVRLAIAGLSLRPPCSAMTRSRSTFAKGSAPSAGRICRSMT